jgi:hypothetical protein
MRKDKKLYILISFIIPLSITVVYLTWTSGMPLIISAVIFGIASSGWIILAIYRARQISKKSDAKRKKYYIKKQTNKKMEVIERTISLIFLVCVVINLVYGWLNNYLVSAHLASLLFILIFGSNIFFLLVTVEE